MQVRYVQADPRAVVLLEKNARFMRHETFDRLVRNVRKDGVLTSVPFAVPHPADPSRWEVLSGNHRVKAAAVAGLPSITLKRAIQLSHNALVGEDDAATLKQIYDAIASVELKEYSGLDDRTLALLAKVGTDPNLAASLEWQVVTLTFLPDEVERIRAVFRLADAAARGTRLAAKMADYDRFMEAINQVGGAYAIGNSATCVMLMLDCLERHLDDLAGGFVGDDGNPRHKAPVPAAAALGCKQVPAAVAAQLQGALKLARDRAPEGERDRGALLGRVCAGYVDAVG
jgi:hypothetical protein